MEDLEFSAEDARRIRKRAVGYTGKVSLLRELGWMAAGPVLGFVLFGIPGAGAGIAVGGAVGFIDAMLVQARGPTTSLYGTLSRACEVSHGKCCAGTSTPS